MPYINRIGKLLKRILIVAVVYGVIVTLYSHFAPTSQINRNASTDIDYQGGIYKVINDPTLNKSKNGRVVIAIYRTVSCFSIGEACTNNPNDSDKNFNHSLLGFGTNLLAVPYSNPPASGIAWAVDSLHRAGFIPNTYAAEGIGFSSIRGYSVLWSLFRNITYLLLVFLIVAIGFMIMFRMKINAQTVVSIENALPRIVLTLIYITFSFAIAGLMIDLMYVMIAVVIAFFSQLNLPGTGLEPQNVQTLVNDYIRGSIFQIWPYDHSLPFLGFAKGVYPVFRTGYAFFDLLPSIIKLPFRVILGLFLGNFMTTQIITNPKEFIEKFEDIGILGFSVGKLPGILGVIIQVILTIIVVNILPGFILGLLIFLTIFSVIVKVFVLLFTSYVKIIFLIVFSPVIIMMEIIPGKNAFMDWVKTLFGELLTFPLVIVFTLTGYAITNLNYPSQTFNLPFLNGLDASSISIITGCGILFITPDLILMVKKSLGLKELPIGNALSPATFFAGGIGLAQSARFALGGAYGTLLTGMTKFTAGALAEKASGKGKTGVTQLLDTIGGRQIDNHVDAAKSAAEQQRAASNQEPKSSK